MGHGYSLMLWKFISAVWLCIFHKDRAHWPTATTVIPWSIWFLLTVFTYRGLVLALLCKFASKCCVWICCLNLLDSSCFTWRFGSQNPLICSSFAKYLHLFSLVSNMCTIHLSLLVIYLDHHICRIKLFFVSLQADPNADFCVTRENMMRRLKNAQKHLSSIQHT